MVQNIQRYISQLGMMVIAVGLSSYNIALFHLINHAFYKGLLFLGAGAVIHAVADNQDFRKYGGLIAFLPLSYSVMLIASLSLVAFPFMTGFYSKDFILESAYGQFHFSSVAVYFIATIGAMFTTLYSAKVLYLTFLTNANGPLINYRRAHEGDAFMSLPLIILAVFSIFFGYITKDMFIGIASGFFSDNSLFTHPLHEIMLETEFAVPTLFKLLPFFLTVTLSAVSLILSEFLPKSLIYFKLSRMGYNIFSFFNQRFLIELFYNKYLTRFILKVGGQTTKVLDKGSIELLGPYGLEKGLLKLSKSLSSLDTGVITSYALYILIGLILYILIPYISLIDISLFLCIIFGLLSITVNTLSLDIPRPHTFSSLHLQSSPLGWLKAVLQIFLSLLSFSLIVSLVIGFSLSLAYRYPIGFMLEQLDLSFYYPFFNVVITLCGVMVIANLMSKNLKAKQLAISAFFAFSVPFLIWFLGSYYQELCVSVTIIFAHLPSIWDSIKGNRLSMGPTWDLINYYKPPKDASIGGSSTGGGGGSSSTGGGGSSSGASGSAAGPSNSEAGPSNSEAGPSRSEGLAIMARNMEISKDLDNNSLIANSNIPPSDLEAIKQRFPLKDPRDVPNSVTLYASFYNLKCKTLIELTALKDHSIQSNSALTSRIAKLENMSNECSQYMDNYEKMLNRDSKRFISKTYKNKPW